MRIRRLSQADGAGALDDDPTAQWIRGELHEFGPEASLTEALDRFAHHDGERLPVTLGGPAGQLVGSISKTNLILALAERSKPVSGAGVSGAAPIHPV
jgi:CBS domain-containing protein